MIALTKLTILAVAQVYRYTYMTQQTYYSYTDRYSVPVSYSTYNCPEECSVDTLERSRRTTKKTGIIGHRMHADAQRYNERGNSFPHCSLIGHGIGQRVGLHGTCTRGCATSGRAAAPGCYTDGCYTSGNLAASHFRMNIPLNVQVGPEMEHIH